MSNRLAQESSLYLRQHGDNPVDWYPWGNAALEAARSANRPILLSIGYSACHWCHVMARESFEDAAIAALMNANFLNIKVDREERPDLDRIYQLAHQALTHRGGGWPLTVFLRPHDLLPFFAGTYFPPTSRHGLPGFSDLLLGVRRFFDEPGDRISRQSAALQGFLDGYGRADPRTTPLDDAPLRRALATLEGGADLKHGGHIGAPKFPHAGEIELQLRCGDRFTGERTLRGMARGGLQDHLGGGFFRYSVDAEWGIPHFEKMLYDNAQLLPLYAEAAVDAEDSADRRDFRRAAEGIVDWLTREMRLPNGGFAASLDADSEHEEGKFYLWQVDEVRTRLTTEQAQLASAHFGLDLQPNFEGHAWHLRIVRDFDAMLERFGLTLPALEHRLEEARAALRHLREQRPRPERDDKCLTAWNGLLLGGLARAGAALGRNDWLESARTLADRLRTVHVKGGRLHAVVSGDTPRLAALLDDQAALLLGLLDLLAVGWRADDLDFAVDLADALLQRFEDRDGGFFLTPNDHERLPQRPKPFIDDATPSGNGLAARALLRLGGLLSEPRYLLAGERAVRAGWANMEEMPQACASLIQALADCANAAPVLIARFANAAESERWHEPMSTARKRGASVFLIPADAGMLPPALNDKRWVPGGRVYWCEGTRCRPRIDSPPELLEALRLHRA